MKRIYCIILLLELCSVKIVSSQTNLVHNSSFEDTIACPNIGGNISPFIFYWSNPSSSISASPDYYNSCAPYSTGCSVPNNVGYQFPRTGNAYTGIFVSQLGSQTPNAREYIEGELLDSLINGKKYCITFYVSLLEQSRYAVNNLGVYLSNNFVSSTDPFPLPYSPQITNLSQIQLTDTSNWKLISGTFIANGGEKYITIGNFFYDTNTDTVRISDNPSLGNFSYYYIDDISVSLCDTITTEVSSSTLFIPGVFTPNSDEKNDTFKAEGENILEFHAMVFNRWGEIVYEWKDMSGSWDGTYKGKPVPDGVYVYKIKAKGSDGVEYNRYGTIAVLF